MHRADPASDIPFAAHLFLTGSGALSPWAALSVPQESDSTEEHYCARTLRDFRHYAGTGSILRIELHDWPAAFSGGHSPAEAFFPSTTSAQPAQSGEALDRVTDRLGITMSQVASALRLTRPTLYRWYEGRQPHASNQARLAALEEFADAWHAARLPAIRHHWTRRIPDLAQTLGELLTQDRLTAAQLRKALPAISRTLRGDLRIEPLPTRTRKGPRPASTALRQHSRPASLDED